MTRPTIPQVITCIVYSNLSPSDKDEAIRVINRYYELLDALKRLVDRLPPEMDTFDEVLQAEEAISKAEGTTP